MQNYIDVLQKHSIHIPSVEAASKNNYLSNSPTHTILITFCSASIQASSLMLSHIYFNQSKLFLIKTSLFSNVITSLNMQEANNLALFKNSVLILIY